VAEFVAEQPAPEQPSAEQGPSAAKWLGAGLMAGLVVAMSAGPADALPDGSGYSRLKLNPDANYKPEGKAPPNYALSTKSIGGAVPPTFTIKAAKHLELCKNTKKYAKVFKDKLYKTGLRQKKYVQGSAIWKRYEKEIAGIKRVQTAYGERLCGKKDGLPRTIASGELVRGGVIPASLAFLYIAGWIGWAGRSYMQRKASPKQEILIDVPLALTCMASGFAWPVAAWQEIVNGEMIESDENIRRSYW
jgi:photosystem I subunit 3